MSGIRSGELAALRKQYPVGSRVRLVRMDDPYRPDLIAGSLGTVTGVDDSGSLCVAWDCGSALSVLYGVDYAERID